MQLLGILTEKGILRMLLTILYQVPLFTVQQIIGNADFRFLLRVVPLEKNDR